MVTSYSSKKCSMVRVVPSVWYTRLGSAVALHWQPSGNAASAEMNLRRWQQDLVLISYSSKKCSMAEGVPSVRNTRLDSKHGRMPHGYAPLLVALQTFIAYWRTFRVQRRPPVGHERRHWAAALGARGWPLQASPPAGFKFATVKLENRDGSWRPCPVMGTATPWPATPSPWQDTAMAEGGGKHIPSSVASQGCKSPIRLWADGGNCVWHSM